MEGRNISFRAYDGVKLAGTLYSAGVKRPCIIMTHGVSSRKPRRDEIVLHSWH
jgi:hypothetical protein